MAMPGLKAPDHFGLTVPNLEQATAFFKTHFDFEVAYQFGPFAADDNWMAEHLNVHPRAEIKKIAVLNAQTINLELFEYSDSVPRNHRTPGNADVGGHHLAFYVEDINAAVNYLKQHNIQVLGEPTVMDSGPSAGESWVYFMAPWGMQLELVSYPQGKAYRHESVVSLFEPGSL